MSSTSGSRIPGVFLSYSHEDQPTARRFAETLESEGFSVWWNQALDAGACAAHFGDKELAMEIAAHAGAAAQRGRNPAALAADHEGRAPRAGLQDIVRELGLVD
jgi:hypothetical protein